MPKKLNAHQKRELKKQKESLAATADELLSAISQVAEEKGRNAALEILELVHAKYTEIINIHSNPQPDAIYNLGIVSMMRADLAHEAASGENENSAQAFALVHVEVKELTEAKSLLDQALVSESSGRGATTALAHAALASVEPKLVVNKDIATRMVVQASAIAHLRAALALHPAGQPINTQLHLQLGDCLTHAMDLSMDSPNPTRFNDVVTLVQQAVLAYDTVLNVVELPKDAADTLDAMFMEQKLKLLHRFGSWSVDLMEEATQTQTQLPIDVALVLNALTEGRKVATALEALDATSKLPKNQAEHNTMVADLFSVCASFTDLTQGPTTDSRALRNEAHARYTKAVESIPDVHASIGELLIEGARNELARGTKELAQTMLEGAANSFRTAIAVDPSDTTSMYNFACVAALAGDIASCKSSLEAVVTAVRLKGEKYQLEVQTDLKIDQDFVNVRDTEWFRQIVAFPVST
eukprot:m.85709 g.85709  ORF g.85709 m.85709 type:complete len:469 (+) comp25892_c0_seq1:176-1582(+)